ncbi:hypothetical protein LWI29_032214 [Acer saccharum]|uniref:Uncharacterized protein n=1 Tax=Acer saccharum TaxID=4024 RepID=A0AA39VPB4_ACESA|nr:hypothetical protein LWI29_032214 [Acer saccharum]
MANNGSSSRPAGGADRSLAELWKSQTTLEQKVDTIAENLRQVIENLGEMTTNLRNRENRAPMFRGTRVSPTGACDQRRPRRHVRPAPPEFSESDEGEIRRRRQGVTDAGTDEEVEEWVLGEPGAAQPRGNNHRFDRGNQEYQGRKEYGKNNRTYSYNRTLTQELLS